MCPFLQLDNVIGNFDEKKNIVHYYNGFFLSLYYLFLSPTLSISLSLSLSFLLFLFFFLSGLYKTVK